ncbi:zinc-dependent alcohol dehydrogenase family protein [Vulgatibacter sp.]|uniref:zinc-dependent alcohol dehydrogenase family protein n=1 Tax=Vulgatibacter sp. TaxID=1971226 RepID=UPI0035657BAE
MRAMVLERFGDPEVLQLKEIDRPSPAPGELLVRVIASGTNPVDAKVRAAGSWAGITLPAVIGYDASGVVEAVGPGAGDFRPGDEVFFTPEIFGNEHGTYADYTVVQASIVARKPPSISHVEAAAVPLAGGTAWEAIVRRMQVQPGETVLIHGGAGGVGTFAVQIARAAGARVIATASGGNLDTLRQLGADAAIDYTKYDVFEAALEATGGAGVDAVLDLVGGDVTPDSCQVTRPFGRIAFILGPVGDLSAAYQKNITLHGVFLHRERRRLEELSRLLERKQLVPVIDEVLPLDQIAKAHRRLDSGHGRGKVILEVAR